MRERRSWCIEMAYETVGMQKPLHGKTGQMLIVSSRELCYYSGSFFLGQMARELEKLGVGVTFLELQSDDADYNEIERYLTQDVCGVVDINSKLPYLVLEDGRPFLDVLGAPFFNYILDHPLYHHPGLAFPLERYHAIAIDRSHQAYMERWYPHLRTVEFLTVPGTRAVNVRPWGQRRTELLFAGTYEPEEKYREKLLALGEETAALGAAVREAWDVSGHMPMEAAVETALRREYGGGPADGRDFFARFNCRDFPELMNRLYPVDKIARNELRRSILRSVAATGYSLTVMGEGWEETELADCANVTLRPACTMARSFEAMADAKCILDINPLFPDGVHDRVTAALANECLCLTNQNPKAAEELGAGSACLYYDEGSVGEVLDKVAHMPDEKRQAMAQAGHEAYCGYGTWEGHVRRLLEMIERSFGD